MSQASLLSRVVALGAALLTGPLAPATAAAQRDTERTPVELPSGAQPGADVGGGGSLVRTIVGLAIVIGVIYGIAWVLRQLRQSRAERTSAGGLATVASVGLAPGKSLHLVRAGNELLLVGVADHAVTPVRTYTEEEAQAAGLLDDWGGSLGPDGGPGRGAPPAAGGLRPQTAARAIEAMRRWTVRR